MTTVTSFLWFESQAREAAELYVSLFDDGRITGTTLNGSAGPGEVGSVQTVEFELAGQRFMALNAGPGDRFNESISFMIRCDSQAQVDDLWERLTEGGRPGPCGWLKDRYGMSWQVVPELLFELRSDPDPAKAEAVMAAMLTMGKIESDSLLAAHRDA
jgi:predicted 3-demethylubiquinone-9 3-methyltransferase (glyoxalase superfamily)